MGPKATYEYDEAQSLPQTLGEVLRALCAPFPEEQCGWRILSWYGPGDNWVWVRYPYGAHMKLRLAESASGGYDISYEDTPLEDRLRSKATLVIYDPERPTEHKMTLVGVGEKELEAKKKEKVTDANVVKASHTYSLKDALEQAGMGVGVGKRVYTPPYTNPDGEMTDKYGIPISEYENGSMVSKRRKANNAEPQPPANSALINDTVVKAWLAHRLEQIDTSHLGGDAYGKHVGALTATLKKMGFDFDAVVAAAWDNSKPTLEEIITLQNLAARTHSQEEIQHLLD